MMKRVILAVLVMFLGFTAMAQNENAIPSKQGLESKIQVEIFPNPTVEYLNVQINGSDLEMAFHLHNIIGNEIKITPEKLGDNKYRINVESLSPGYYLLAVKDPSSKYNKTFKFLKR